MQPKAHQGHYIPKNLRVLMRPQGPNTNTRVPIRSPDLRQNHVSSHDLKVQSRSQEPLGSNYDLQIYQESSGSHIAHRASVMIPGSKREPPGSPTTSRSQTRSQDLKENPRVPPRPLGPKYDLMVLENLRVHSNLRVQTDLRVQKKPSGSKQPPGSKYDLRV